MTSPYNSYAYAKKDWINRHNVMKEFVSKMIANNEKLSDNTRNQLEILFKIFQDVNTNEEMRR